MPQNIEIRSEPMREIMGQVPRWIIRRGTSLIFAILVLLLIGSWVFKYPEIISSKIIITTENPPADIVAKMPGKLTNFHLVDSQRVSSNEILAIVENSANFQDVLLIDSLINSSYLNFEEEIIKHSELRYNLGDIQAHYSLYMNVLSDYNNFKELNYYQLRIDAMKGEIIGHQKYKKQLSNQAKSLNHELRLAQKQITRDSTLLKNGIIAPADFEKTEKTYLQSLNTYQMAKANLASTDITISEREQQILDLRLKEVDKNRDFQANLKEAFDNLSAAIEEWKQQYLLISPIEGIISLNKFWSKNQNIEVGDVAFTVVPEDQGDIIGITELPVLRSGKVKPGQKINIKIDNYPYMEYGIISGRVASKSLVPNNDLYRVKVELTNGLITLRNQSLEFNQEMKGTAEIVTEDLRLIQRIVNPLKVLMEKNL